MTTAALEAGYSDGAPDGTESIYLLMVCFSTGSAIVAGDTDLLPSLRSLRRPPYERQSNCWDGCNSCALFHTYAQRSSGVHDLLPFHEI